jgi:hypothetical protein
VNASSHCCRTDETLRALCEAYERTKLPLVAGWTFMEQKKIAASNIAREK